MSRDPGEGLVPVAIVAVIRITHVVEGFAVLDAIQRDQGAGIVDAGERAQQDRAHHAEYGGVGGDPQGERDQDDRGEAGIPREHPECVAQIPPEIVDQSMPP